MTKLPTFTLEPDNLILPPKKNYNQKVSKD